MPNELLNNVLREAGTIFGRNPEAPIPALSDPNFPVDREGMIRTTLGEGSGTPPTFIQSEFPNREEVVGSLIGLPSADAKFQRVPDPQVIDRFGAIPWEAFTAFNAKRATMLAGAGAEAEAEPRR